MIILETPRLILRHEVITDLDDLYALYCDPEITRYIPDAPRDYEETRLELEWHQQGHPKYPELGLWATILKENGEFIGRCGLLPWTIEGRQEVARLNLAEWWNAERGGPVGQEGIGRKAHGSRLGARGRTPSVLTLEPQTLSVHDRGPRYFSPRAFSSGSTLGSLPRNFR